MDFFQDIRSDIGVGVTEYFEQLKTLNICFSVDMLENIISTEFYKHEKPIGVYQTTWDECFDMILDGTIIGVYMNMIELMYCDLEDVMAVVAEITPAVFQRVRDRFASIMQTEMDMAESAARRIQGAWRVAIANPNYEVCKRRLLNEFNDLKT